MTTNRARASEEEYFARQEVERKRDRAAESEQTAPADQPDRDRLKALHFMRCPKCGMALETMTLQGVEIDRCGSCNGTWLDEGELERLAQREPGLLQRILSTLRGD